MELNMKHLKKLIKEYKNLSKMDWAVKEDMADMYKQDAQDYKSILNFFKDGNISGAKKLIQYMDTLPREHAIISIGYDLGNDWVEENLDLSEFDANITFIRGEKDYMDIHLMSMCEHNVIANSTFSWWGAWLNNNEEKVVIAPTEWHPLHKKRKFSDEDIICEDWIRVEVK